MKRFQYIDCELPFNADSPFFISFMAGRETGNTSRLLVCLCVCVCVCVCVYVCVCWGGRRVAPHQIGKHWRQTNTYKSRKFGTFSCQSISENKQTKGELSLLFFMSNNRFQQTNVKKKSANNLENN